MSKKKIFIFLIVTIVVGGLIFIIIDKTVDKKLKEKNSNSNTESNITSNVIDKKTEVIEYSKYQELMSGMYDDDVFAIIIMKSNDEICNTFKDEALKSFNNRKTVVYELDVDKITEEELSTVISDVSKIQKYEEPTLITPTMIVSKKGKIVYVQEGLIYSTEIKEQLDKNEIE